MAVDTAEKRFSMLSFGDGTNTALLPEPDGSIDLDDRQHLFDMYSGIAFSSLVAIPGPFLLRTGLISVPGVRFGQISVPGVESGLISVPGVRDGQIEAH